MGVQVLLEIDKIRQLIEMMVANDLVEVSLRDGEEEVNLRRPNKLAHEADPNPTLAGSAMLPAPTVAAGIRSSEPIAISQESADEVEFVEISSPMVGTFYAASDPDSPAFVDTGTPVSVGTVVCILEAMKVFNEIKSEVAGTIERILVKNAEAVEFGQTLFLVRPA